MNVCVCAETEGPLHFPPKAVWPCSRVTLSKEALKQHGETEGLRVKTGRPQSQDGRGHFPNHW